MASRCDTAFPVCDRVRIARSARGPVTTDVPGVTCYGCGERLSFVRTFKRRRCGIEESVRSHFRHIGDACGGEGVEHRAAKHALAVSPHSFFVACGGCGAEIDVSVEGEAVEEAPFGEFRVDVGFTVDGELRAAVEVLHSHPIGAEKEAALTTAGVAWVEVTAAEVLRGGERLRCRRAAILRCDACRELARVAALAEEEQQAMALAEAERRVAARVQALGKMTTLVEENERSIWKEMCAPPALPTSREPLNARAVQVPDGRRAGGPLCRRPRSRSSGGESEDRSGAVSPGRLCAQRRFGTAQLWQVHGTAGQVGLARRQNVRRRSPPRQPLHPTPDARGRYTRWLAGWTQYKVVDERGRARPQTSHGRSSEFVSAEARREARELLKGLCLACFNDTGADWRNWCPACFGMV